METLVPEIMYSNVLIRFVRGEPSLEMMSASDDSNPTPLAKAALGRFDLCRLSSTSRLLRKRKRLALMCNVMSEATSGSLS